MLLSLLAQHALLIPPANQVGCQCLLWDT
jgi:hypothetical protein